MRECGERGVWRTLAAVEEAPAAVHPVDVDENVDGADDLPTIITNRGGVGEDADALPTRLLHERFAAAVGLSSLERQRHPALVHADGASVEREHSMCAAVALGRASEGRMPPPNSRGALVVRRDEAIGVTGVRADRQQLECVLEERSALAPSLEQWVAANHHR